jgi:acetyl esterase/lipase
MKRSFGPTSCVLLLSLAALPAVSADPPKGEAGNTLEYTYTITSKKTAQVHFPEDWKPGDKRPAIVFFFGGGWTKGTPKQFEPQAIYLAKRGMVAVRADYTLGKGPDVCVEDARSAMRWVRGNAKALGVDPDRIVSSGGSAGGHLAACVGCCPIGNDDDKISSQSNAMVLFNPVLDMEAIAKGGKFDLTQDKAAGISPIRHYDKKDPPAIIFFGTDDRLADHGRVFLKSAKELGTRVELVWADGQPHGFFNRSPWQERTLREAEKFLLSIGYLKGESTLKVPESALKELTKETSKE